MFLIPLVASVVLFILLWWAVLLARPVRTGVYVAGGVLIQCLAAGFSVAWVAGLLLNVGVGVYLAIHLVWFRERNRRCVRTCWTSGVAR
jgi:hypothetical protein